ncbi:hypothetical protein MTBBW1_1670027 [Desulfamplus magnetovallimortis]|uniref:Uncharacterized protein n=1 Tax=Desulfamplus magnetovallimortis TaxID=1246637 RepID=A0A1W1H961_9BACT|nr:hypothetical protein MTBBW1_1670027 [Desulfamplus magnetovallimortis]
MRFQNYFLAIYSDKRSILTEPGGSNGNFSLCQARSRYCRERI